MITPIRARAAVAAVAVTLLAVACAPAPAPTLPKPTVPPATLPTPSLPKPTLPPKPTTTTTTTTTSTTTPSAECPTPSAVPAHAALRTAAETLTVSEAAAAANTAAEEATAGGVPVVITEVDGQGRPTFTQTDPVAAERLAVDLAGDGAVVAVEADVAVSVAAAPSDPRASDQWAFTALDFTGTWACGTGAGVTIAVVDTGVDASHPDFAGKVAPGASILGGVTATGAGGTDPNGHGTHVAGIAAANTGDGIGVAGVAPDASILPVRALNADGDGLMSDIGAGVRWAVDQGADVVNLSVGGDAAPASLAAAVDFATAQGVLVVAAAGNGGPNGDPQYPAAIPDVLAVAAYGPSGLPAPFSTRGAYVDVTAPGVGIWSSVPGGWAPSNGTSQASPHVAGLAAVLLSAHGHLSPAQLTNALRGTATDAGAPGFDTTFGHGIINPTAALRHP